MEATQNLDNEKNEEHLCTEIILYDVLYNIFNHLNISDLNKAATVCKSWYHAAKMEKLKRGPQIMILQALEDFVATGFLNVSSTDKTELVDDFKLSLRVKPSAGLFFTDGKYPASADCDSVPYEICVAHQWTQPKNCIYAAIETVGVSVNDNSIGGEKNITAAIFLPIVPSVNYATAETNSYNIKEYFQGKHSVLTDITNKLFTTEQDNVSFIIFIYQWKDEPVYQNYHNHFLNEIFSVLKTRHCPGTYSLWGGAVNDIFTTVTDTKPSHHSTSFYAMGISGSSVKSWSIVLSNNWADFEIRRRLRDFRKSVKLKASTAFLIIPSHEDDVDRSKIDAFRHFFPTTELISLFSHKANAVFSVDSMKNENNPELKHTNSYAYMILTYNL